MKNADKILCLFRLIERSGRRYRVMQAGCKGTLEFRPDPSRYVCLACLRVFSINDVAFWNGARGEQAA